VTPDDVRKLVYAVPDKSDEFGHAVRVGLALRVLADVAEEAINGYQPTAALALALARLEALQ
jgi:hypothetical protein